MIQLPSGCMPMISECACWAICRISVLRYASGIQSRGSIRWSAAITASKYSCEPVVAADPPLRGRAQLPLGVRDLVQQGPAGRVVGRAEVVSVHPPSVTATLDCRNAVSQDRGTEEVVGYDK